MTLTLWYERCYRWHSSNLIKSFFVVSSISLKVFLWHMTSPGPQHQSKSCDSHWGEGTCSKQSSPVGLWTLCRYKTKVSKVTARCLLAKWCQEQEQKTPAPAYPGPLHISRSFCFLRSLKSGKLTETNPKFFWLSRDVKLRSSAKSRAFLSIGLLFSFAFRTGSLR